MTTPIFPQVDPNTGALPGPTEARFVSSAAKGVANGVAALNSAGVPITDKGVPMAVIGTAAGTAADAAAVDAIAATLAPKASPAFTGTPTVPTASPGTSSTQAASTAFVASAVAAVSVVDTASLAPKESPTFTGTVAVPTPGTASAAANKAYVDSTATAAVTTAAVRLTGDQAVAGVKTFTSPPVVPDNSFAAAKVSGLTGTLAAKADLSGGYQQTAQLLPGTVLRVFKSGSTWPLRPTARTDVLVDWVGADPSPPQVFSGTGGMLTGDTRSIPAA